MKRILTLILLLMLATPAQAVELSTDVGFDTPASWMVMGDTSHASVTGSAAVFTGATKMTMVSLTGITGVKRGQKYRLVATIAGYTSGSVMPYAGLTMMGSSSGSNIPVTDGLNGLTAVADNFTTSNAIESAGAMAVSGDAIGAFRMTCGAGPISAVDPIVYPNLAGRSHGHQFYGNTAITENTTTYALIRAKGWSTCNNTGYKPAGINRSGYWMPAIYDGLGNYVSVDIIKLYYKRFPNTSTDCIPEAGFVKQCVNVPNGLRMITGWVSSDNSLKMGAAGNPMAYACSTQREDSGGEVSYGTDMNTVIQDSACVAAYAAGLHPHLEVIFIFPNCWNGTLVDSTDHRSHMAQDGSGVLDGNGVSGVRCPATHPYRIANITGSLFYTLDAQAFLGKWRLSSDGMFASNANGSTLHLDYFEGWSPSVKSTFHTSCIDGHLDCQGGNLGNNTQIKQVGAGIASQLGSPGDPFVGHMYVSPKHLVPTASVGLGRPCKANGTCTVEVIAQADGEFGLMTEDANLSVTSLTITKISSGGKGPITVTH